MNAVCHRDYVLLVEDEEKVSKLLCEGHDDYEIKVAVTLADAAASVLGRRPDAVILDLNLPCSKGAMTFLRMHAICQDAPIIIFSSDTEHDVKITTAKEDYVRKGTPGAIEKVWERVRSWMRAKSLATASTRQLPDMTFHRTKRALIRSTVRRLTRQRTVGDAKALGQLPVRFAIWLRISHRVCRAAIHRQPHWWSWIAS